MAECTPNRRASYVQAATTRAAALPPTITGFPATSDRRAPRTEAKNASMSTWRMTGSSTEPQPPKPFREGNAHPLPRILRPKPNCGPSPLSPSGNWLRWHATAGALQLDGCRRCRFHTSDQGFPTAARVLTWWAGPARKIGREGRSWRDRIERGPAGNAMIPMIEVTPARRTPPWGRDRGLRRVGAGGQRRPGAGAGHRR